MTNKEHEIIKTFNNVESLNCGDLNWITADIDKHLGMVFTCSIYSEKETLEGRQHSVDIVNIDGVHITSYVSMGNNKDGLLAIFSEPKPTCKVIKWSKREGIDDPWYDDYDDEDWEDKYTLSCKDKLESELR